MLPRDKEAGPRESFNSKKKARRELQASLDIPGGAIIRGTDSACAHLTSSFT
jgi:hypothetical protein